MNRWKLLPATKTTLPLHDVFHVKYAHSTVCYSYFSYDIKLNKPVKNNQVKERRNTHESIILKKNPACC